MKKRILKEKRLREQSNQKIYSLKLFRAIVFLNNLFAKEKMKRFVSIYRQVRNDAIKLNGGKIPTPSTELKKITIRDVLSSEIIVPENLQKKYKVKLTRKHEILEMPAHLADEIIMNYVSEKYCYDCFERGFISIVKRNSDSRYCKKCGKEFYYEDIQSQLISRHSSH